MKPNPKGLDKRLSDQETCLLTMTNLRLYLCKAESKFGRCRYLHPEFNEYKEECVYIDGFLNYVFAQIELYMKLRDEELKKSKKDEKNERKRRCFTCLF